MAQHELCYKLHELMHDNDDKIREGLLSLHPDECSHDDWLRIVNELQDRINWMHNLVVLCDRSYFNERFDVKDVRLTLEDYVYNVQSIKE